MFSRLITGSFSALYKLGWPGGGAIASQCEVCMSWPAQPVCDACVVRFASAEPRCRICAIALPGDLSMGLRTLPERCTDCLLHAPPLDRAFAAVDYAYPWSSLVSCFKFGEQPGWAPVFATLMRQVPGVQDLLAGLDTADWILPMPLSAQRLQTRGFNQAWQLAAALARQSGSMASADARLLLRVKNTRPQSELNREERLANVRDAFVVDPLRHAAVAGRRVVLVDDVMTSGASIYTAAQTLRLAGALEVTALVFARTPSQ